MEKLFTHREAFTQRACTQRIFYTQNPLYTSLYKTLPSTTSSYRACTKTSWYYFVLQSLHKDFLVLLRTTELAQSTCQHYCVLQILRKVSTSAASYCARRWRKFQNRKPKAELSCCESQMPENPPMDSKVVGVVCCLCWNGCNGCSGHITHSCWM